MVISRMERSMIAAEMRSIIDDDAWEDSRLQMEDGRAKLRAISENWRGVTEFLKGES